MSPPETVKTDVAVAPNDKELIVIPPPDKSSVGALVYDPSITTSSPDCGVVPPQLVQFPAVAQSVDVDPFHVHAVMVTVASHSGKYPGLKPVYGVSWYVVVIVGVCVKFPDCVEPVFEIYG